MSKNGQMRASDAVIVGPDRPTAGAVSLIQGVYGARGNLELVACDVEDGLWVFWFNADLDTDPPADSDVPPGSWSAGLAFAAGRRYRQAQILQSVLGPDHLELVALTADGVLESWYWSPAPGFQHRDPAVAVGVSRFGATHDEGTLRVSLEDADGETIHLVSSPVGYPSRAWSAAADGPGLEDDALAAVLEAGVDARSVERGTARAATSQRLGGRIELTWRDDGGAIRHLAVPRA